MDYKNLGAEDRLRLRIATGASSGDRPRSRHLRTEIAAGSERKKTGSYYTPTSLISCLLDSALDPVLTQRLQQQRSRDGHPRTNMVDPACGSGPLPRSPLPTHGEATGCLSASEEEPPLGAREGPSRRHRPVHLRRRRESDGRGTLQSSLWMEALEPGKPLSFLEHRSMRQ